MFVSSNTRIQHPVSIYTKSFSYVYSLLNLLCKFGTHCLVLLLKAPSSSAEAQLLLLKLCCPSPGGTAVCREHISHHFCEQPGFQFQTELFKSLTLQQLVKKGDSCSNTKMVTAGTGTGAQVLGAGWNRVVKRKTMQELPAHPLHTKGSSFRDLCSAWFTNKEKPNMHNPQA